MRYETEVVYVASKPVFDTLSDSDRLGDAEFGNRFDYAQCRAYLDTPDLQLARLGTSIAATHIPNSFVLKSGYCSSVATRALTRREGFGNSTNDIAEFQSELAGVPVADIRPVYIVEQQRSHRECQSDEYLWHCSFDRVTFTRISDNASCMFHCIEVEVTGDDLSSVATFHDELGILRYLNAYRAGLHRVDSKQSYAWSLFPRC